MGAEKIEQRLRGVPVASGINDDFEAMAASMSPTQLSVARSKNDAFGEYLRAKATETVPGEDDDARFKRLYGGGITSPLEQFAREHPIAAGASKFIQGTPFVGEYADEAVGQGNAQNTDKMRAMQQWMDEEHPWLSKGLEIGGGVAGAMATAGAALPAIIKAAPSSLGMQMLYGAILSGLGGTAEGAISGYGSGVDPDSRRRAMGDRAMLGGVLGLGIGGLIPPLSKGVGAGVKKAADWWTHMREAKSLGLDDASMDYLVRALEGDDALTAGVNRVRSAGPDAMVLDAGRSSMAVGDAAANRGGKSSNIINEAVESRANRAAAQFNQTLDDTLGGPPVPGHKSLARSVAQSSSAQRQAAYDAAYASPVNYSNTIPGTVTTEIEEVLNRIPDGLMTKAVREANEDMMMRFGRNRYPHIMYDETTNRFVDMPNVQQLDYIKRALNYIASSEVDDFGRKTARGLRYAGIAKDLSDAIGNQVDAYRHAVRLGGDKILEDEAVRVGRDLMKMSREDVATALERMDEGDLNLVAKSFRRTIDDKMAKTRQALLDKNMDAREATTALRELSSRDMRDKMRMFLPEDVVDQFDRMFDQVNAALSVKAGVIKNSATAPRMIADRQARQSMTGPLRSLKRGRPMEAGGEVLAGLLGGSAKNTLREEDAMWEAIARFLVQRGQSAEDALSLVSAASRHGPANAALADAVAGAVGEGSGYLAYQSGNRALVNRPKNPAQSR